MFDLIFGLFWESITLIFTLIIVLDLKSSNDPANILILLSIIVFNGFGIYLLVKGLKKILDNKNTNKLGEECYGYIIEIAPNGNYINGYPQLNAKTVVYIKSEGNVKEIAEYSGTETSKYNIGEYVKVKYYNGDINFIERADENSIPNYIKDKIYCKIDTHPQPIVYYESEDIVQVDGVRYKRIDSKKEK